MKRKLLQKIANFIVNRIKSANTMRDVVFWFNIGIKTNDRLINNNIYLN